MERVFRPERTVVMALAPPELFLVDQNKIKRIKRARNPILTVQALAWRTAAHLAENWKAIAK